MSTATAVAPCPDSDIGNMIESEARDHRNYYLKQAMRILRQAEDADEAVQSGFLGAWRYRHQFVWNASPRTWITKILINVCFDMIRKRKTRTIGYQDPILNFMHDSIPSGALSPEQLCFLSNRQSDLISILGSLSETESEAFTRSTSDEEFDRRAPQFKSARYRAMRRLRDGMRSKGYDVNEECSKERVY